MIAFLVRLYLRLYLLKFFDPLPRWPRHFVVTVWIIWLTKIALMLVVIALTVLWRLWRLLYA